MKTLSILLLAALSFGGLCTIGCETSHSESDKPGVFGGNVHKEDTTTKNPITGDVSHSHTEQKTN